MSRHGINSTVGGDIAAVKRYVRTTRSYPGFADADIKWSDGAGDDFPPPECEGAPGDRDLRGFPTRSSSTRTGGWSEAVSG